MKFNNHYIIRVSALDQIKVFFLFIKNTFCCFDFSEISDTGTLLHLFRRGEYKLQKDFSIEKVIKNLRDLKLAIKSEMLNPDLKLQIQHD